MSTNKETEAEKLIRLLKRMPPEQFLDFYLNWRQPTFEPTDYGYTLDELKDLIDKKYNFDNPEPLKPDMSIKTYVSLRILDKYLHQNNKNDTKTTTK